LAAVMDQLLAVNSVEMMVILSVEKMAAELALK
jgi:hypothetical protein